LTTTTLDEETPGRTCPECEADLSDLPTEALFCLFCGAELDVVESEDEDGDISGTGEDTNEGEEE
jgi:predicted amidophosphoribosyltransferase